MSSAETASLYPIPQIADLMNTPDELRARRQWVPWKLARRKDRKTGEPCWDKIPYTIAGKRASTTDQETWCSFEEATEALQSEGSGFRGVGFVFSTGDQYTGIDLDGCRNPESGGLEEWAEQIVLKLDGYVECSPSGSGVHIIVRGKVPRPRKTKRIEAYSAERFFTMTGRVL